MNHNEKMLAEVKVKLSNLINALPNQFALENTKYHLVKALDSIKMVENKREKRKVQQSEQARTQIGFASLADAEAAIKILDDMMATEQKVLNNAQQQQEASKLLNG